MAKAIKIADEEMALVRREAELSSRSLAGQVAHWLRIGRSIERSPDFSYAQVREALAGRLSPDALTGEEQVVYVDRLMSEAGKPTDEQRQHFERRRQAGQGVGQDSAGNIVSESTRTK